MMLQQQQINARPVKCYNSKPRPLLAFPAPRTRAHLSSQSITCQALPSSRPDTQLDTGRTAGPLPVLAAAAAAAVVLLWPAQAAHALLETQLEQIKQAIDKDFQQGQVRGRTPGWPCQHQHQPTRGKLKTRQLGA